MKDLLKYLPRILLILFFIGCSFLLYYSSPEKLIEFIGVENAYFFIFILALIGGITTFLSSSRWPSEILIRFCSAFQPRLASRWATPLRIMSDIKEKSSCLKTSKIFWEESALLVSSIRGFCHCFSFSTDHSCRFQTTLS